MAFGFGRLRIGQGGSPIAVTGYDPATRVAVGRAPPNAGVTIALDGVTAGTTNADARGRWAFVFASIPAKGKAITARAEVTSAGFPVPDPVGPAWLLRSGTWDDTGVWDDAATWTG